MAHVLNNTKLTSLDDLFKATGSGLEDAKASQVVEIPLSDLYEFDGHTFKVIDDNHMDMLVESIKDSGVHQPGICRKRESGGYEIIEGHRRHRASELAGNAKMPFWIVDWDDDTAKAYMALSNLTQRKEILISEKARSYRELKESLEHKGKKGLLTATQIADEAGDSESTVKRLIRLSYLSDELLELVDNKILGLDPGKNIAFLSAEYQKIVYEVLEESGFKINISMEQAKEIRDCFENDELDSSKVKEILTPREKVKKRSFSMKQEVLDGYFTPDYSNEEIENIIIGLLEDWKAVNARG